MPEKSSKPAGQDREKDSWISDLLRETRTLTSDKTAEKVVDPSFLARIKDLRFIKSLAALENAPSQFGPYQVVELLGVGGIGEVYKVHHSFLKKEFALKVIKSDRELDQHAVARFKKEIEVLGRLDHPGIVAARNADEQNGLLYLVMDLVTGRPLSEIVLDAKRQSIMLPIAQVCSWIGQAAEAIAYAHANGVLHRDIKPANLMLDHAETIRVLDLGLAKVSATKDGEIGETDLTRQHQIIGTPSFMAPEQLQGSRDVGERADVYSLGATLYYLLTGQAVYTEKGTVLQRGLAILNDPVPDIRRLRSDLPDDLADIVTRCIAKRSEDRIGSAGELAELLSPFTDVDQGDPLTSEPSVGESKRLTQSGFGGRKRLPLWLIPMAFFVISFFGVVFRFSLPDGGELVIQCDDPHAKIMFSVVRDGELKSLMFAVDKEKTVRLDEGIWHATISGADADQFRISSDRIEMIRGGKATVSIRRFMEATTTDSKDGALSQALHPKTSSAPLPSETNSIATGKSRFALLGQHNRDFTPIDWQTITRHCTPGLLPRWQPLADESELRWQLRPWLEPTGQPWHQPYVRLADVDPTGKYLGVITVADAKVLDLVSGRVTHVIPSPKTGTWETIQLSANADQVLVASNHDQCVEVRDRRNRLISHWYRYDRAWYQSYLNGLEFMSVASWVAPGRTILLITEKSALVTDINGTLLHEVTVPAGTRLAPYQHRTSVSPDGNSVILTSNDNALFCWNLASNSLAEFGNSLGKMFFQQHLEAVAWSPDGQFLAVSGRLSSGPTMAIANQQGEIVKLFSAQELSRDVPSGKNLGDPLLFCWSPDSKSIAFDNGRLMNTDGTLIRHMDVSVTDEIGERKFTGSRGGVYPFWRTLDRIDFVSVGVTTPGFDVPSTVGHVDSYSPTGKSRPAHNFGNLLRPSGAVRSNKNGQRHTFYHQGRSRVTPQRIATTTNAEQVVAMAPIIRPGDDHSGQAVSQWDGRSWETAPFSPLVVRDIHGNQVAEYRLPEGWSFGLNGVFANSNGNLAISINDDSSSCVVVLDESLQEIMRCDIPIRVPYAEMSWSPDDSLLAISWGIDGQAGFGVWDMDSANLRTAQEVPMVDEPSPRIDLSWSSDSQQLAVIPVGHNRKFMVYRSSTNQTLAIPHEFHWAYNTSHPVWINARQLLLNHQRFDLPLGSVESSVKPITLFSSLNQYDTIFSQNGQNGFVISRTSGFETIVEFWRDGQKEGELPVPNLWGRQELHGKVLVAPIGIHYVLPAGMLQVNLEQKAIDHLLFLTDNGKSIRFNGKGSLLDSVADWDRYLAYVMRYSSGVEVYLNADEFRQRQAATPEDAALCWVLDSGGAIRLSDANDWIDPRAVRVSDLEASMITGVDLSRCMVDDMSLEQLAQFPNLKTLVLRNSTVQTIQHLPQLPQLEEIDLSNLPIFDLKPLQRCSSLQDIRLARTAIDSSHVTDLISLDHLEWIDLSETAVDRFALIDLPKNELKGICLTGTPLANELDLQQLEAVFGDAIIER